MPDLEGLEAVRPNRSPFSILTDELDGEKAISAIEALNRNGWLITSATPTADERVVEALKNVEYICGQWEEYQGASSLTIAVRVFLSALAAQEQGR